MSNTLSFAGNLGGDAELRYTPNGIAVLQFSVAMSSGYGDKKHTEWVRVSMWGKVAESSLKDYLKKGTAVYVSGECTINTYQGNDGLMKASLNLTAHAVDLVGNRKAEQTATPAPAQKSAHKKAKTNSHPPPGDNFDPPYDDDIPF